MDLVTNGFFGCYTKWMFCATLLSSAGDPVHTPEHIPVQLWLCWLTLTFWLLHKVELLLCTLGNQPVLVELTSLSVLIADEILFPSFHRASDQIHDHGGYEDPRL